MYDGTVNVEEAVYIGKRQLDSFIKKLPSGFHGSLNDDEKVNYMKSEQKRIKIGDCCC